MKSALEGRHRDPVFMSHAAPTVLLSPDFVIRAATPSHLATTGRREEELLGLPAFEAFPLSPGTSEAESGQACADSFERVLRTRSAHYLSGLRYDVPDSQRPGEFLERRWVVANIPILDGDEVVGVRVRVDDVSLVDDRLVEALRAYRDVLAEGELRTSSSRRRVEIASAVLAMAEGYNRLGEEVANLRRALRSRPAIEQAKGIIMADRRCTPEAAFELLRQLSNETNVRLADVAAAIVYQASQG